MSSIPHSDVTRPMTADSVTAATSSGVPPSTLCRSAPVECASSTFAQIRLRRTTDGRLGRRDGRVWNPIHTVRVRDAITETTGEAIPRGNTCLS